MTYEKTVWRNRIVERPRTFTFQQNADGSVTLIPAEGVVTEPGTPVNAANLNKIENAISEHQADNTKHVTVDIAKFKKGSSTYTDNDTSQTFTDIFCTIDSLVTIVITSATPPKGVWSVNSAGGSFTITSTVAEDNDITFDYFIQKAVG